MVQRPPSPSRPENDCHDANGLDVAPFRLSVGGCAEDGNGRNSGDKTYQGGSVCPIPTGVEKCAHCGAVGHVSISSGNKSRNHNFNRPWTTLRRLYRDPFLNLVFGIFVGFFLTTYSLEYVFVRFITKNPSAMGVISGNQAQPTIPLRNGN